MSQRVLQRKHSIGDCTIVEALAAAWPKEAKAPPKRGSRLDALIPQEHMPGQGTFFDVHAHAFR